MFGFARFNSGKFRGVPRRWVESASRGAYAKAVELGLARPKKEWPYTLVIMDEAMKTVLWHAPNYQLVGNVLVTVELDTGGGDHDSPATYKTFMATLQRLGRWSLPLSRFTWILGTELAIADVHREIGDAIGIRHHSFSVVNLMDGRGIGWDAPAGVMTELAPAHPSTVPFERR